ncbi:hypothetical protein BJ875DRAFT_43084 [Amylocarpus encephaloides]|uniref:Uncharacterized protein n=1 Tax=Amylocarpus encephaloides TaxID=45428 RepID=A0A9P7YHW4_9HELO|nr:hypothetical protein BJ875DRAFT_43084 [Amylocarpus encephaloides]
MWPAGNFDAGRSSTRSYLVGTPQMSKYFCNSRRFLSHLQRTTVSQSVNMHFSKILAIAPLLVGAAVAASSVHSSNFTRALVEYTRNKTLQHGLEEIFNATRNAAKHTTMELAIDEFVNGVKNTTRESLSEHEFEELFAEIKNIKSVEREPRGISDGLSKLEFVVDFVSHSPQDADETDAEHDGKALEARGGIGTGIPGRVPPCPGWPTVKRYNLTHTVEFSILCLCNVFKKIKRTDCSMKPMPY